MLQDSQTRAPRLRRGSPKNPKSNLSFWRLPCPPITPRTVPLCVRSCLLTAATAAFPGKPATVSLRLPRPQGSASPRWPASRQGYRLSPVRQLRVRLRSQLRPRTPLLRCSPRSNKTQNRLHPRLSRPNPRPKPASRPGRIHQRIRHRFLARKHPHLPQTVCQAYRGSRSRIARTRTGPPQLRLPRRHRTRLPPPNKPQFTPRANYL